MIFKSSKDDGNSLTPMEVTNLQAMQPHSTGYYVSTTALGAMFGAAVGYGFNALLGQGRGNAAQHMVDGAITLGAIQFFETWAEDRKVQQIRHELDIKYGPHTGR